MMASLLGPAAGKVTTLVTLLAMYFDLVTSSNIVIVPFPSYSHVNPLLTLGEIMIERGHNVHIYLPSLYTHIANIKATSKVKVIEYQVKAWEWNAAMHAGKIDAATDYFDYMTQSSHLSDFRAKYNGYYLLCKAALSSKILDRHMKVGVNFDLAVVDSHPLTRCHYGLMYRVGIPYVSYSQIYDPWFSNAPAMPSYVPSFLSESLTDEMSLWQRIMNTWTVMYWGMGGQLPAQDTDFFTAYVPDKDPVTLAELAAASRLWLSDTNFLLDYPRPLTTNEVIVSWGLMREAKPLGKDHPALEGLNKTKDGIIVISLDQNIALPARIVAAILTSFKIFPSYHVIWQYTGDLSEENIPGNVHVLPYLPLNDIVGHPKTKAFVSSADMYHQNLGLYHGVPTLLLPLHAAQRHSAYKTQQHGYGSVIHPADFTLKGFVVTLKALVQNDTFYRRLEEPSRIMHSHQGSAQKSLQEWIILSLANDFSDLRPAMVELPWYKYIMFDILVLMFVIFGGLAFLASNTAMIGLRRLHKAYRKRRSTTPPVDTAPLNGSKPSKTVAPSTTSVGTKPQGTAPTTTTSSTSAYTASKRY